MKINIIASSSEGNCTHIYTDKASILIDAGISAKKLYEASNIEAEGLNAIFITHEHSDHIKGLGPIGRKTGATIYIHEDILNKIEDKLYKCTVFQVSQGEKITIGDLEIDSFSTKHDAAYSCGFIILDKTNNKKLGYLTDTGNWTKLMSKKLKGCDAYIIEADYDTEELAKYAEYDDFLKERISSDFGHLSNDQTMSLLKSLDISQTSFVCFAHLSPRTNSPELVLNKAYEYFPDEEKTLFSIAPKEFEL
jgi:phosphoribosyl 1,2-cyclic phosphodiesterase